MFRSLDKGQSAPPCLPPPGAGLLLRALFKRPRPPQAAPPAPLASEFVAEAAGREGVERYNAALGFAPGSTPLTWYYLMVQRAHLATMLGPAFPYRIAGMVHVENALELHGAAPGGQLRLSTRIDILPPGASGAVYCALATEGWCGEALVFTCSSTYLAVRGRRRGKRAAAPEPAAAAETIGAWTLARSAGRGYARVSGDWNPIHLAGWTARLMGLREPIIHGMHSVGKACARLEQLSGQRVTAVSVRFRSPIPLGAGVVLAHGSVPGTYALYCGAVLAAEGSFRLG
ncbi:MaoC/PaaZ C-terminal domain-containing protein [Massilia sp. GCM10023247]|uniref:MaoC/PaaZ C-terminal domain-containing protein n=1 Tax=Massilia sp. GCM10023247 TaxID=3252643 RepID=UPI003619063D